MIEKAEGMSWEVYWIRSYSSESIVQAIIVVLYDDFDPIGTVSIDTGDFLFEVDEI